MTHEHQKNRNLPTIETLRDQALARAEWIRTDDAAVFVTAINEAGLELTPDAIEELTTEGDRRFGNAYSWLTRDVAMSIMGRRRRNGTAQNIVTTTFSWNAELGDEIAEPLGLELIHSTGRPGADLVIDLMQQAQRPTGHSDVPATDYPERFKEGSCRDAEVYYIKAANDGVYGKDQLREVAIDEKIFWKKTFGEQTYLNLEPLTFNGVSLPPGCLFRRNPNDDKLQLLRVTGFAFAMPTAIELFGSQITDHFYERDGEREVARAFDRFSNARDRIVTASEIQ